ncbi:MAG TPA: PIG-L family deacetylase [Roseiflexaceae bacterium]|nr:PIG-L family deacetylase [Roseiflexaceae bacterium]
MRRLLRAVRNLMIAIAERCWALGFGLAGRLAHPAARHWSSPGGMRVLAIAPHPDDEAIGCGGTLLRHRACGDTVTIAYITDGRRSRALGLGPEQMTARRRQEAMAGARALGADHVEWLGLPEGEWAAAQLLPMLQGLLHTCALGVVYAPSRVDYHPEHCRVAEALALALAELAPESRPLVRVYQVQVPLTRALTNLVADISCVAAECAAALDAYVTQRGNMGRALRQRRYAAAYFRLKRQAEEFWELTAEQYVALHDDRHSCLGRAFRGLRFHSFSDPLAYLWGRSERRRLALLVANASATALR